MIVQLHKQNRADPTKTELIEQINIESIEQQQEWIELAMSRHEQPTMDSDWNWLLCNDSCPLFKKVESD